MINPATWRQGTTPHIPFGISEMSHSRKKEIKHGLRISYMFKLWRRIWSRSTKLGSKACKSSSTTSVALLKRRVDSSLEDGEKVECSSSTQKRWNRPCIPRVSRSTWILSYDTRESTISIFNGFELCSRRGSSSDFQPLSRNKLIKCVKHVNSKNNINTHSQRFSDRSVLLESAGSEK